MNALRTAVGCVALVLATTPAFAQGGEEVVYFHADAIGSVRLVTDANGQVRSPIRNVGIAMRTPTTIRFG
jgi:hypothetical protein